jgi:hypothetical protein
MHANIPALLCAIALASIARTSHTQPLSTPDSQDPHRAATPGPQKMDDAEPAMTNRTYSEYRAVREACDSRLSALRRENCRRDVDARYGVKNPGKITCGALTGDVKMECLKNSTTGE